MDGTYPHCNSNVTISQPAGFRRLACDFSIHSACGFPHRKFPSMSESSAESSSESCPNTTRRILKIIDPNTGEEIVPAKVTADSAESRPRCDHDPSLTEERITFETLRGILNRLNEHNALETYRKIMQIPWYASPKRRRGLADLVIDTVENSPHLTSYCATIAANLRHEFHKDKLPFGTHFQNALQDKLHRRISLIVAELRKPVTGGFSAECHAKALAAFALHMRFVIELSKLNIINKTARPRFQPWVDEYTGRKYELRVLETVPIRKS